MRARATTTCSILRGTTTDSFGDEVDVQTPVKTGVPFSIMESDRRVYLPAEGATRVVRKVSGRCAPNVDIRKDDRLKDEKTGQVYLVVALHNVKSPVAMLDTTVELSYTN